MDVDLGLKVRNTSSGAACWQRARDMRIANSARYVSVDIFFFFIQEFANFLLMENGDNKI